MSWHPNSTAHHEEQINEKECDQDETADEDVGSESEHCFVAWKVGWWNVAVLVMVLMHAYSLVANSAHQERTFEFPQNRLYFHKNIAMKAGDRETHREYLTNQRRSNLPVEESRQRPSREPATELTRQSGNWLLMDGTRKALTANGLTERMGSADLGSQVPENSEMAISCDLGTEPGLRKLGK